MDFTSYLAHNPKTMDVSVATSSMCMCFLLKSWEDFISFTEQILVLSHIEDFEYISVMNSLQTMGEEVDICSLSSFEAV